MSSSPPSAPTDAKAEARGTARALGLVSVAILCSRILGLVREVVLNSLFGSKQGVWGLDCLLMAFKAPNMLRDLFAEGALSTAFVTVFSKKIQSEGEAAAWKLGQKMMTLAAVFMSIISALGVLLAPIIIGLLAYGWRDDPEKVAFTTLLARIMYPFILLVSLAALVMGMLNARKVFFVPAMSSTFFNVGSMLAGGILGWWLDPEFGTTAVICFAVGTLVGGLLQLLVQLPALKKVGFRFAADFGWKDAGVKHTLQLMWPAIISGSVVQVNVLLNTLFASYVSGNGPVTWLNNAFRLMQLPLGLFGVGLATVSLPTLARMATNGISDDFRGTLSKALRMGMTLSIPSAVGLAMLAWPIMSLVYGNGRAATNPEHVPGCALALQTYAIGLVFYSGLKVLQPAFYAIEKRFVPMYVSIVCVLASAGLNYLFVIHLGLGHQYLALSTSLTAALNFLCLLIAMKCYAGRIGAKTLLLSAIKLSFAALGMAGVCWMALQTVLTGWNGMSIWMRGLSLGGTMAVAAGVYFGVSLLLKNEEVSDFLGALKRRIS
ncbi:MAG: murein biosynthesis integral membrane protein MurJ [Verrucomicrobiaceae bacterium]|nr:murein biosynthesis integral membrane protein MurJ [Verrucomicrobiaceae bacterium]